MSVAIAQSLISMKSAATQQALQLEMVKQNADSDQALVAMLQQAAAQQQAAPRTQLPAAALRKDGEQDIVFVVHDGKAERRAVRLGGNLGDDRQVLAGVSAGETVITEAPAMLKDGDAVRAAEGK